jgi:outer membrane protein OmpA-like peptidoglycan-associated protein
MSRRTRAALAAHLLLGVLALPAGPPEARADDPFARGFDPDPVRPALSIDGTFSVETAGSADPGAWRASARLSWIQGLLALRLGSERDQLLESRLGLDLVATRSFAVPLLGRAELGAHLPVALWQRSDFSLLERQGVTGRLVDPIARVAIGDLRLGAKTTLLPAERTRLGLAVGALLELRLPTGQAGAFTSDGLSLLPTAIASRAFGRVRLDGQVGYDLRGEGQYAQLVVHDGWTAGLAATVRLPPAGRLQRWTALLEATGGWPRGVSGSGARYRAALSARAGVRAALGPRAELEVGAGTGLGEAGYGREAWRVFAGVRFNPPPPGWVPPPQPAPPLAPARAEPELAPGPDDDGDGVLLPLDLCPDQPGTLDLDGCPDRDGDSIPDPQDDCPDQPGPAVSNGCPPAENEPLVEIETERLSLRDAIAFDFGKDTIKPESDRILNQIATLLSQHQEVGHIRVEGHTDNVGSRAYNLDLSERRAAAVVKALVSRGVKRGVLVPAGYGFDRPVASNDTALGRAKNRRVEFVVVDADGAPPR